MRPPITSKSPDRAEAPRQREEGSVPTVRQTAGPSSATLDFIADHNEGLHDWTFDEDRVERYEDYMDERNGRFVGMAVFGAACFWFGFLLGVLLL